MALNFDKRPYMKGYQAGLDNQSLDSCRFTKTAKRIAWMAGYRDGKSCRELRSGQRIQRDTKSVEKSLKWLNVCREKSHVTN